MNNNIKGGNFSSNKYVINVNNQFDNVNYSNLNLTKNEKDNTLMLSKIDDTQVKQINNEFLDYDQSFDFGKQISEISRLDYNEEENLGLTQTYYKNFNIMQTNSAFLDLSIQEIDMKGVINKKLEKSEINYIPEKKFQLKTDKYTNVSNLNNMSNSINKVQSSISKIDNKNRLKGENKQSIKYINKLPSPNLKLNYQKDNANDFEKFSAKFKESNKNDVNDNANKVNIASEASKLLEKVLNKNKIQSQNITEKDEVLVNQLEFKPYNTNEIYFDNESEFIPANRFFDKTINQLHTANEIGGGPPIESIPINTDLDFKLEEPNIILSTINQGARIDPNIEYATFR
jgi:hypothetical protein